MPTLPAHYIFGLTIYFGLAMGLQAQVPEHSHPEFKSAVLQGFYYTPPSTVQGGAGGASADPAIPPRTVDPDAVLMNEVRVKSRFWDYDLAADIQKTKPLKAETKTRFGTGVYQKDFGKVRGSVATVLYVPIRVNASW